MAEIAARSAQKAQLEQGIGKIVGLSWLGSVVEWYDFYLYAVLSAFLSPVFFPGADKDPMLNILATFGSIWVGFLVRPFGGAILGRLADRVGREATFYITVLIMAGSTVVIGLLPGYDTIGILSAIIVVLMRALQGLSLGGQYGSALVYVAEHSDEEKRGRMTGIMQTCATFGLVAAIAVILILRTSLPAADFKSFGYRIPFLISAALLIIPLVIHRVLDESPLFEAIKAKDAARAAARASGVAAPKNPIPWKQLAIAFIGMTAGAAVCWYVAHLYTMFYMSNILGMTFQDTYTVMIVALLASTPVFVFTGALSDRFGRKWIILAGCALMVIGLYPIFMGMQQFAHPVWVAGKAAAAAGKAKPDLIPLMFLVWTSLVGAALTYGPIAAALVEYFPARVRVISFSIPYHVAYGVLGGAVPLISASLVEQTGNNLSGLWYPMAIAAMTAVAGAFILRETKHVRIWDEAHKETFDGNVNPEAVELS